MQSGAADDAGEDLPGVVSGGLLDGTSGTVDCRQHRGPHSITKNAIEWGTHGLVGPPVLRGSLPVSLVVDTLLRLRLFYS